MADRTQRKEDELIEIGEAYDYRPGWVSYGTKCYVYQSIRGIIEEVELTVGPDWATNFVATRFALTPEGAMRLAMPHLRTAKGVEKLQKALVAWYAK